MAGNREPFHSSDTLAACFHEMALPFFQKLGFSLVDDPTLILSPYHRTRVTYKYDKGLFVSFSFDPADGNYARVEVGRQWKIKESGLFRLSNDFCLLAAHYNLNFPEGYTLGVEQEMLEALGKMFEDIKSFLPVVIEKVRLSDLKKIEGEKFGALVWAKAKFGADYQKIIEISEFENSC